MKFLKFYYYNYVLKYIFNYIVPFVILMLAAYNKIIIKNKHS